MNFFIYCFALAFLIFIWLKTNALYDFLGWLLIEFKCFKFEQYSKESRVLRDNLFYPLWLYSNYPTFLTTLLSCPLCLSFWASIIFIYYGVAFWFAGAFIVLLMFSVLNKLYKHGR